LYEADQEADSQHRLRRVKSYVSNIVVFGNARRPRYHAHFTPTYSSWLNQVERWFGLITHHAIRRGSFQNVPDLVVKIKTFTAHYNEHATPFAWTATADLILEKIERLCKVISGTGH
jgi:putative transposase